MHSSARVERGGSHARVACRRAEAMQLEQFRDVGWCVVEGVFSRAEVGALARVATEICDRELAEVRNVSCVSLSTLERWGVNA